ncbi:IS1-like element transposase [Escherichia coli]
MPVNGIGCCASARITGAGLNSKTSIY